MVRCASGMWTRKDVRKFRLQTLLNLEDRTDVNARSHWKEAVGRWDPSFIVRPSRLKGGWKKEEDAGLRRSFGER